MNPRSVEFVDPQLTALWAEIQKDLRAVPKRIADQLAETEDPDQVEQILKFAFAKSIRRLLAFKSEILDTNTNGAPALLSENIHLPAHGAAMKNAKTNIPISPTQTGDSDEMESSA